MGPAAQRRALPLAAELSVSQLKLDPPHRLVVARPAAAEGQGGFTDELELARDAVARLDAHPNLTVLGPKDGDRLAIISVMFEGLHHDFAAGLLDHLFGVQSRSGCACAGPYGHRLLGIDLTRSREFEREVVRGCEGIKPGWTRLNFNYFISDEVFDFLIEAVHLVANRGWLLLPDYSFEPDSGLWRHRRGRPEPAASLHDLSYRGGRLSYPSRHVTTPEWALPGYLDEARAVLDAAEDRLGRGVQLEVGDPTLTADFEHLRWFPMPGDVLRGARPSA